MKLNLRLLLFSLILVLMNYGCEKDACETLNCQNGAECIDGACICPEGIIGKECELIIDPCIALECDHGTCVALSQTEAFCQCENGYEGDRCEKPWSDKFVSLYGIVEVCDGNGLGFPMNVTAGPRFNQLTLSNFRNLNEKVVADLLNSRVMNIYSQPMSFGFVSGSGIITQDERTVTLNFTVINGADTLACSAILTK